MEAELMTLQTPKEPSDDMVANDVAVDVPEASLCCLRVGQTRYLYHRGRGHSRFPAVLHVGPNWPCMTFTFALIIAPSLILMLDRDVASWVSIVLILMIVLTFVSFAMVACSDPGIIREDYVNAQGADEGVLCGEDPHVSEYIMTYVAHCRIRRPPNAVHCYECEVCIDGLDHHCPWTGKCIGKRTLRWFYLFLWLITLHLTFSLSALVYYIIKGSSV
ncbi:hypothetical protein ACHHYP_02309 [Achlya hypogyna]|uniref:Palmitoyltransferase n=1 Tax=Achlya hypogyna TaxID=1202772 RepID=A0A1V9Z6Z7_ACHHY|nr:hypothetical protein ACHHYP_02309 [Achlya hypogyna]